MKARRIFCLLFLFLFILLCACTSTVPVNGASSTFSDEKKQIHWLDSLQNWEASGRFAVKKGNEGSSGSFEWTQYSKDHYKIHFYGPFGTGNAYLTGYSHYVAWKDNEGTTMAKTPDELIFMKTHFIFPVSHLYDWILGRPVKEKIQNKQWEQGHLIYLEQANWQVYYVDYMPVKRGELPQKIEIISDNLTIKLIISHWKINQ